MSCITVAEPLRWLNKNTNSTQSHHHHHQLQLVNMACIVAGNSPSVLSSCRSPSLHDSEIEICAGSPRNHGFQTPRSGGIQSSFVGSRLRPVLAIRDENLLWSEGGKSPVKKLQQRAVSLCVNIPEEKSPDNDSISGCKGLSPPLKRKRPPRLDIPLQLPGLEAQYAAAVEQPMEVNEEGFHYAVSCKKGRREFMEDTHKAMVNVLGDSKQAFFGVFDGHSGRMAADFAAENMGQNIVDAMLSMGDEKEDIVEQAVRAGYLTTDAEFLKQEVGSGTACVTALIIDGNLVVSNAGDCRAVISRDGASEALTCDHRAGREDERQRIENLGGIVDLRHGVWRVQGSLAVSRAIGDSHMKEWIIAEPDTRKIEITSDCEFLILASDGLWDKVSNQEAVDIARPFCVEKQPNLKPLQGGPIDACKKLVELAVTRKSQDDVSVMIVQLGHFCMKKN